MKFYVVQRDSDNVEYDEYDSVVVYAHNMSEAMELAVAFQGYFDEKETTVTPVQKNRKARIVHESFNAG